MIKGQYTIAQLKISPGISYQTLSDCKIKGQAGEHGCCEAVLELSENTKEGQIRVLVGNEASITLDGKILLSGIITQAGLKTANGYNSAKIVISTIPSWQTKRKKAVSSRTRANNCPLW